MLFPSIITDSPITRVILDDATAGDDLPDVLAVVSCTDPAAYHGLPRQTPRRTPLLAEHALGLYGRPSLRGHRVISDDGDVATGFVAEIYAPPGAGFTWSLGSGHMCGKIVAEAIQNTKE